jgi:hypothetical protein
VSTGSGNASVGNFLDDIGFTVTIPSEPTPTPTPAATTAPTAPVLTAPPTATAPDGLGAGTGHWLVAVLMTAWLAAFGALVALTRRPRRNS